jgi:putative membrane protein
MAISSAALLADMWHTDGHMGGGWWIVMMIWMVLFWGAVIFGVVWLARGGSRGRSQPERRETPLEILDRRFAEGAMSADEYHQRRDAIASGPDGSGGRS